MKYLALYGLTALGFFAIDFVWITRIAQGFYQTHIGHYLRPDPVIWAAVGFYCLYLIGVVVFAVLPGLEAGYHRVAGSKSLWTSLNVCMKNILTSVA